MVYAGRGGIVEVRPEEPPARAGLTPADADAALARIEVAVAAGETDLRALGFWGLVGRIKLDRLLVDREADRVGRIDGTAFRAGVRLRFPVWVGITILLFGVIAGALAVWTAFVWRTDMWKGLALVASGAIWSLCVHSPTHWFVGLLIGIRWTDAFIGGPFPPRPGVKSEYGSYLRADPDSRAWMHASGALATKLAPFVALAFWPASGAPGWAAVVLLVMGALEIVTDIVFSRTSSDWKKFTRERRIARTRRAALLPGAPAAALEAVTGPPAVRSIDPGPPALPRSPSAGAPGGDGSPRR